MKLYSRPKTSAKDPFKFDADPDPGSALKKNGSGSWSFLQDLLKFFNKK